MWNVRGTYWYYLLQTIVRNPEKNEVQKLQIDLKSSFFVRHVWSRFLIQFWDRSSLSDIRWPLLAKLACENTFFRLWNKFNSNCFFLLFNFFSDFKVYILNYAKCCWTNTKYASVYNKDVKKFRFQNCDEQFLVPIKLKSVIQGNQKTRI